MQRRCVADRSYMQMPKRLPDKNVCVAKSKWQLKVGLEKQLLSLGVALSCDDFPSFVLST